MNDHKPTMPRDEHFRRPVSMALVTIIMSQTYVLGAGFGLVIANWGHTTFPLSLAVLATLLGPLATLAATAVVFGAYVRLKGGPR